MISALPLGQMGPWQKSQLGDSGSGLGDGGSGGRDWLAVRNHWLLTALQGALRTDTKDCMWVGKRTRAAMGPEKGAFASLVLFCLLGQRDGLSPLLSWEWASVHLSTCICYESAYIGV